MTAADWISKIRWNSVDLLRQGQVKCKITHIVFNDLNLEANF